MKICKVCHQLFKPAGRCSKYCSVYCFRIIQRGKHKDIYTPRRIKQMGGVPGVGKGGRVGSGKDNPAYKNGIGVFQNERTTIKNERRFCERCDKDLKYVSRYYWCIHHKDHDRTNNDPTNWELLCKRCHQIEHNCIAALEGATTIPKGSRVQEDSKRMAPHVGDDIVWPHG